MTQPYSSPPPSDDEIDLGELIAHLWETKWRVLFAVMTVFFAYLAFISWHIFNQVNQREYSLTFDLPFVVQHGTQLPDGSPFVLVDILNPSVLNRVHQQHSLDAYHFSPSAFRRSVRIEPYAPDLFLIRAQYQQLFNERNLSSDRQAELEAELDEAISLRSLGGFRITITLPDSIYLPEAKIEHILQNIPYVWALRTIEERGVLDVSLPIISDRMFDSERFANLDYLISIDLLLQNLTIMRNSVNQLMMSPGAGGVRDPETGLSLQDLLKVMHDIERYDLRQLRSPVQELGLTKDVDRVQLFFNRQLQDLSLLQNSAVERARVTREVLNTYQREDMTRPPNGHTELQLGALSSPQLGDAFLDRLIALTRQGGGIEFRQNLVQDILTHRLEALEIELVQQEIMLTLAALETRDEQLSALEQRFGNELEHRLLEILDVLRHYTYIIERMHQQLTPEPSAMISALVLPRGGSFQVHSPPLVSDRQGLIFALLMLLTVMGTIFVSLVADMMHRRRQAHMERG